MAATLIGLSGIASRAQTDEEVSALLAEALLLPDWETLFTATAGVGHKDNVFLSNIDPQSSPFASASGEIFIMRLAPQGPRVTVFGTADARAYFASDVDYQEFTSFNHAAIKGDLTEALQGSMAAGYFYQDQVLDLSVTETNRQPSPVLGHRFSLEPGLRLTLPGRNWLAVATPVARQLLDSPLDDYWIAGSELTLGHHYRWDSEITLTYEPRWRLYDSEPARTSTGEAIPGSTREALQQDVVLAWRHHWDAAEHWRTVIRAGGRLNTENGGGYFDYARGLVAGRLHYQADNWSVAAEGRLARYDYRNQTATASTSDKRKRTEWGLVLTLRRQLSDSVAWHVRYEYDTVLSNDPLETYDVNTLGTAFSVEF